MVWSGRSVVAWGREGERRSALSRFTLRGWTREASGFSLPVQPVQPVQPKLEREKRRLLFSCRIFSTRIVSASSYRLRFRSPGRTGWPGWTAPTTAGITLVQLRYRKVGRRSSRLDTQFSLPRVRDYQHPRSQSGRSLPVSYSSSGSSSGSHSSPGRSTLSSSCSRSGASSD